MSLIIVQFSRCWQCALPGDLCFHCCAEASHCLWDLFCLALSAGALCSLVLLEEWASLVWVLPLNAAIPCCGRLCIVCCDVHAAVVHAACLPGACWSVVSIFEFVILMNKALVNTYLEIFMWMCILILLLKGMRICGDFTLHRTVNVWFWLLHTFLRSVAAHLWTSYRSEHFVFAYGLCWTYFHVLIGFSFVFFSVVPRQMLAFFF